MRSKIFIKNILYTGLLQVVTLLTGFIIPRIMIKNYGSEINGLLASITQLINYFTLLEAGLGGAAIFALYKPISERNKDEINKIITYSKKYYNKISLYFLLLVILFSIIFPYFIGNDYPKFQVSILFFLIGLGGALNIFTMSKYRIILTADQKIFVISISNIVYVITNTLIIYFFAYLKYDIILLKLFALVAILLRSLILHLYLIKKYKDLNFNSKIDGVTLPQRWDVLYLQILGMVNRSAQILIITFFMSLEKVSIYSVYNLVLMGMNSILGIFSASLGPSFGGIIASKEKELLKRVYGQFEFIYYILITWAYSCTIFLINPFIKFYTDGIKDINYVYPFVGILITINGFLYNLKTPQGMMVISAGKFKETKKQVTIQASIGIISSIIFVRYYGIKGAILGFCVSNFYRVIGLAIYIPKNVTGTSIKTTIIRMLRSSLFILISIFISIKLQIEINSIYEFIKNIFVIGGIVLIFVIGINFITEIEEFKNILKRLKIL